MSLATRVTRLMRFPNAFSHHGAAPDGTAFPSNKFQNPEELKNSHFSTLPSICQDWPNSKSTSSPIFCL